MVVGCDSGALQVVGLKKYPSNSNSEAIKLEGEGSLSEHNDTILDMDDLGGEAVEFVTCSQDKRYLFHLLVILGNIFLLLVQGQ